MNHPTIFHLLACLTITVSCSPTNFPQPPGSGRNLEKLDAYINQLEKEGLFGSFLFMENDEVLLEKSIGFANQEKQIRSSKNTIYPFGSIVKDYTRTATLLLATEGHFDLEDTMSKFYPNIPTDKRGITIAQLLQHRSGLETYHSNIPELRERYPGIPADLYPGTKEEALEYIFNQELEFEPGTDMQYSNSGYTLLAYLLEDVLGQPFDKIIREKIFDPAQTKTTDFYQSPLWQPEEVAVGYGRVKYGKENSAYYWPRNPHQLIGNGGMSGTLQDLYKGLRYMMALEEHNPSFAQLSQQYKYIEELPQDIVGSAGGGDLGNVAVLFGIKSKNQFLLFASNNDDDGMEDIHMLRKVTRLAFGFDIATLAPEAFEEHSGEEDITTMEEEGNQTKWGLPDKQRFRRMDAFLDVLSHQMSPDDFMEEHCVEKLAEILPEQLKTWPKSTALKVTEVLVYDPNAEIKLVDTLTQAQYIYKIRWEESRAQKLVRIRKKE